MNGQLATPGRIVMFVLAEGNNAGDVRPAIAIRRWDHPMNSCNLQVFLDGTNDTLYGEINPWKASVAFDPNKAPGTWHWPEREAVAAVHEATEEETLPLATDA